MSEMRKKRENKKNDGRKTSQLAAQSIAVARFTCGRFISQLMKNLLVDISCVLMADNISSKISVKRWKTKMKGDDDDNV